MKTKPRSRIFACFTFGAALAVLAGGSGCFAVAVGAGAGTAVAYVRGQLETTVAAKFEHTEQATNDAVKQLGFAKVSERKDALIATLVVRNADDKKIEIRLENLGADLTRVRIRVGVFGDEALSLAILDKIKAAL